VRAYGAAAAIARHGARFHEGEAASARGALLQRRTLRTVPAEPAAAHGRGGQGRLKLVVHIDTHRAFNEGHRRQLSPDNFRVAAVLQKQ
jgi:hypothetical protein